MSAEQITATGGARVGWINATWPFARLTISATHLQLASLGTYDFTPQQVVSLERYGSIPVLGNGIRISHNRPDYPPKIIFWTLGSPTKLLEKIAETGFSPSALPGSAPERSGFPVRWSAIAIALILWNGLFFLDDNGSASSRHELGLGAFIAILLAFFLSWAVRASEWLQGLVLREGHSVGEIKSFLLLLQLVSGLGGVAFALQFFINHAG
jgi:hypothetical protein